MAADATVAVLEAEPELGRFLRKDERADAARVALPVRSLERGDADVGSLLEGASAFGALILDGMLLHRQRIGEQPTLRLLGPGDLVSVSGRGSSSLIIESSWSAAIDTRLALLGREFLMAMTRWPQLAAGLHVRQAEQAERASAQLAICQLPRVADRVLGQLWLLAEAWGRVTPSGVSVPIGLTHDALGGLIGARRSTVTLALGELMERGAIVRQDRGWLLLESLPEVPAAGVPAETLEALPAGPSPWSDIHSSRPEVTPQAELLETVARLQQEHAAIRENVRERLHAVRRTRDQVARRRARNAQPALTPPPTPSS